MIYWFIYIFMTHYLSFPLKIFIDMNCLIDSSFPLWPLPFSSPPHLSAYSALTSARTLFPLSPLPSQCSSCLSLFPLSILNFFPGSEPMSDAVIFEPIPYRSALRENCTHIIAVRTRAGKFANLNSNLLNSKKSFSFHSFNRKSEEMIYNLFNRN